MKEQTKVYWLVLGALILAACALRIFQLGAQDIWWDEARNIFTASRPLDAIASAPELDIHPPFYFHLLHFWVGLAGTSEFVVRFFSLWFGVALVPLAFRLGVYLKDRHVGMWAAFLTAFAPFFVDEAQQTRMYTLALFLSALSIYFLLRAVNTRRRGFWIAYVVTASASFYTHYSFVYVLAVQNLFLCLRVVAEWRTRAPTRDLFIRWVASQVAVGLLYVFQVPNILRQMQIYGNPGMTPPPLADYLSELVGAFLLGTKVELDRVVVSASVVVLVLVVSLIAVVRYRRSALPDRGGAMVLLWFVVPFVAYFVVLQKSPQFTPRYLMVAAFPFYLLLAEMLGALSRRSLGVGVVAGALLVGAFAGVWQSQYFNPVFFNDDTRGLAQFISENAKQDDIVFVDVPFPFFYYYHGDAPAQYLFVDIHSTADVLTQKVQGRDRLFFIQWYKSDTDPRGYVTYLLDKYAKFSGDHAFRGYNVAWYQLPKSVSFSLAPPPQAVLAVFGDRIMLTGFAYGGVTTPKTPDVNAPQVALGSKAWVALWWKLAQPVLESYKVSIQLRDANGNLAAQDDRMLINDRHLHTSLWMTDEAAINVYTPELLEGVKPGEYMLYVIVYDPETGKRLNIGSGDTFVLGKLQIIP